MNLYAAVKYGDSEKGAVLWRHGMDERQYYEFRVMDSLDVTCHDVEPRSCSSSDRFVLSKSEYFVFIVEDRVSGEVITVRSI